MNYKSLAISILLLLAVGFVYSKFKINLDINDKREDLDIIKKYLLDESDHYTLDQLSSIKKPILWIHLEYNKNSRKWYSFGSRNSHELNQDYLYLTLRSIINKCGNDFHVVMIDDDSFKKLLSTWKIDLSIISNPQKAYFRSLGLTRLLHTYGGLLIEPSMIMFKSLYKVYRNVIDTRMMCVGEFPNTSTDANVMHFMPSMKFIGCVKNCEVMHEFSNHLEHLFSNDYTENINCENLINKWLFNKVTMNQIKYIDGKYLGVKDEDNKLVNLDMLMSETKIDFDKSMLCLYVPKEELLKRNAHNWYVHLNEKEALLARNNIGKYLLLSNDK